MATNFVSNANMTTIMTSIANKIKALNGAYIFKGSSTLANLPANPTAAMIGYTYNMSEDFTTTNDFVEGAGKKYPAGTNVSIADVGTSGSPSIKFDVVGSFFDVESIEDDIEGLSGSLADEFAASSAYGVGDVVMHENGLYKFKAAHTADDPWDGTEVDPVTMETLVDAAEPDPLTDGQVNTLIGLLD